MASEAAASSFAVMADVASAPSRSIVVLGPAPGNPSPSVQTSSQTRSTAQHPTGEIEVATLHKISRSIVAVGEPAVTFEAVAAVKPEPSKAPRRPAPAPMVIRGGIAGDAFSRSVPAQAPAPQPQPAAAEPAPQPAEKPQRPEPTAPTPAPPPAPPQVFGKPE